MGDVVSLKGGPAPPPEPSEDVIAALEDMLVAARAGALRSIVVAKINDDGTVSRLICGYVDGIATPAVVGVLERLKLRVLEMLDGEDGG